MDMTPNELRRLVEDRITGCPLNLGLSESARRIIVNYVVDVVGEFTGRSQSALAPKPIPLFLTCPRCMHQHVDEDEFATRPHHTHACQYCGLVWRPALEHTVGVRFLPGFKNPSKRKVRRCVP